MNLNEGSAKKQSTLGQMEGVYKTAEVVRTGDAITIPEEMSYDSAIEVIRARKEFDMKETRLQTTINVHPYDGAAALESALTKIFGWAQGIVTPGLFRDEPPTLIDVAVGVGVGVNRRIPWGRFSIPGVVGWIQTDARREGNRFIFAMTATVLRKDEPIIARVFEQVRQELVTNSIYRGKALRVRFKDDDGDDLPVPAIEFMETKIGPENLIYSNDLMRMVTTNLFTPISRAAECLENGIPVKRGVLLGGPYGTGKTLAATAAAKLAVDAGITYVYIPRAAELKQALEFVRQYQSPAGVVFCEDIDRVVAGDRSVSMDDILNTIDGIDSKTSHTIVVLTTNHLEEINPAMLRPGRLDAVIEVVPPDADAVLRLIKLYGGALVSHTDLTAVSKMLEGQIPAVVEEVVKRAKLAQMTYQPVGTRITTLSSDALIDAALTIKSQTELLRRASEPAKPVITIDELIRGMLDAKYNGRHLTDGRVAALVAR